MKKPKEKQMYQNAIICLSDGSRHTFTGRAMAFRGETRTISDIKFTEPKPVPKGYLFEPAEVKP